MAEINIRTVRELKQSLARSGISVLTICLSYLRSDETRSNLLRAFAHTDRAHEVFDFIVTTSEKLKANSFTGKTGKVLVLKEFLVIGFSTVLLIDDSHEILEEIASRQLEESTCALHIKLKRKPQAPQSFRSVAFLEDGTAHLRTFVTALDTLFGRQAQRGSSSA